MKKEMVVLLALVLSLSLVYAVDFNTKINAEVNGFDSQIQLKTYASASDDYDYYDLATSSAPDNYSVFYSNLSGTTLGVDIWNSLPRNVSLVYELPSAQSDGLTFTWTSFDKSYDSILYFYSNDSTYTDLNGSADMFFSSEETYEISGTDFYAIISVSEDPAPEVNVTYPLNITYSRSVTYLNYTASDNNVLGYCWYEKNGVNSSIVVAGENFTGISTSEGLNEFNVWCNDSKGNENYTLVSFTITPVCGDGTCYGSENCASCPADCGICPVTTSPGGGGGSTSIKIARLKIEVPSYISIDEAGLVEIPITLTNDGDINFNKVSLSASISKDHQPLDLEYQFDTSYFENFRSNQVEAVLLSVSLLVEEVGTYEVSIDLDASGPVYDNSEKVYIDLIQKNVSAVKKMLVFAENMMVENPECYDLKEMVEEASRLMEAGENNEAIALANEAINACKLSVSGGTNQIEYSSLTPESDTTFWILIGTGIVVAFGIFFSLYRVFLIWRKV